MSTLKPIAVAALIALLLALLTLALLLSLPATVWAAWQPATCRTWPDHCFCEMLNPSSPVLQPINSASSLLFLFPGCAILWLGCAPRRPARHFPPVYAAIVGGAALVTGLGSAFYHASLTFSGQFWDVLGMLLLAGFMLVYAMQRSRRWPTRSTLMAYVVVSVVCGAIQWLLPDTRRYLFAVVLLAALALEYHNLFTRRVTAQPKWLTGGLALFALAFGVWILDQSGLLCDPAGLLQGHAIWHLLGAAGVGLLYRYYTSEKPQFPKSLT